MNTKLKFIIAALTSMLFISCSGNTDTEVNDLVIKVDKTEIMADGLDKVTFTTYCGSEDVSKSENLYVYVWNGGNKVQIPAGENTFSTYIPGDYELTASFLNGIQMAYTSENVKFKAKDIMNYEMSGYKQKMLAMCFTSIWCQYCPILHQAIKEIQTEMPGRIIPMAVHEDFLGSDPFATGVALRSRFYDRVNTGDGLGLPLFSMNLRKSSQHITNEKVKIVSEIEKQSREHPSFCGVSITSKYTQSTDIYGANVLSIDINAGFKADIPGYYSYHIFLVEDNVMMEQFGDQSYVHYNVLRHVTSDNLFGTKLNQGKPLTAGEEYKIEKTIEMTCLYKPENMRVIVSMLYSGDGGKTYECNNTAECPLKGSVDYLKN